VTLDYASGACTCGRDRISLDLNVSGAFWYLEKHCTFAKVHAARCFAETDSRFGAETDDCLVCQD
jgi:hypothetical protein